MPSREKLSEFTAWCAKHITGDEKGEAQIFLDHPFHAFGYADGLKEAGATLEMRVPNRLDSSPAKCRAGRLTAKRQRAGSRSSKPAKIGLTAGGTAHSLGMLGRNGRTAADMANSPRERILPFPETIMLLVGPRVKNNNRCVMC